MLLELLLGPVVALVVLKRKAGHWLCLRRIDRLERTLEIGPYHPLAATVGLERPLSRKERCAHRRVTAGAARADGSLVIPGKYQLTLRPGGKHVAARQKTAVHCSRCNGTGVFHGHDHCHACERDWLSHRFEDADDLAPLETVTAGYLLLYGEAKEGRTFRQSPSDAKTALYEQEPALSSVRELPAQIDGDDVLMPW